MDEGGEHERHEDHAGHQPVARHLLSWRSGFRSSSWIR
jgi:hypothetical protein